MENLANTSIQISTATLDDKGGLVDLLTLLFEQEQEFQADPARQGRGVEKIINNPSVGEIITLKQDGQLIGMVTLLYTVSTALGTKVGLLEDMIIAPDQRGRGLGGRLLQAAIHHAAKMGCRRLTLLTDHDNRDAHRFYNRNGFQPSPMRPYRLNLELP